MFTPAFKEAMVPVENMAEFNRVKSLILRQAEKLDAFDIVSSPPVRQQLKHTLDAYVGPVIPYNGYEGEQCYVIAKDEPVYKKFERDRD